MARARDIKGKKNNVIAVIGDGALTGGMALEALNDAGYSGTKMLVILNDNEMSISKNIGGMNLLLSKLRTKRTYTKSNLSLKKIINKIPVVGKPFVKIVQRVKRSIKQLIIPKMFFEDIRFRYLGPVDGHDIAELERMLKITKELDGPVLLHVLTKKGKGYKIAEENLKQSDYIVTIATDKTGLLDIKKVDSCYQYGYIATMKEIDKIKEIIQEK